MSKEGVWGDHFEILALSAVLNCKFCLHILDHDPIIVKSMDVQTQPSKTLNLAYLSGKHYTSIRRLNDKNTDQLDSSSVLDSPFSDNYSKKLDNPNTNYPSEGRSSILGNWTRIPKTKKGLPDKRFKINRFPLEVKYEANMEDLAKDFSNQNLNDMNRTLDNGPNWSGGYGNSDTDLESISKRSLKRMKSGDLEFKTPEKVNIDLKQCHLIQLKDEYSVEIIMEKFKALEIGLQTLNQQRSDLLNCNEELKTRFSLELDKVQNVLLGIRNDQEHITQRLQEKERHSCPDIEGFREQFLTISNNNSSVDAKVTQLEIIIQETRVIQNEIRNSQQQYGAEIKSLKLFVDSLIRENKHLEQTILSLKKENIETLQVQSTQMQEMKTKYVSYEAINCLQNQIDNLSNQILVISHDNQQVKEELLRQQEGINQMSCLTQEQLRMTTIPNHQELVTQVNFLQDGCQKLENLTAMQNNEFKDQLNNLAQELVNLKSGTAQYQTNCINHINPTDLETKINDIILQETQKVSALQQLEIDNMIHGALEVMKQQQLFNDKEVSSRELQNIYGQLNLLSDKINDAEQHLSSLDGDLERIVRDHFEIPPREKDEPFNNFYAYNVNQNEITPLDSEPSRDNMARELGRLRQAHSASYHGSSCYNQRPLRINTNSNDHQDIIEEEPPLSEKSKYSKALIIPWRGRILTPTIDQLREFEGDLDLISQMLGSRDPKPNERNYKIRITWKGFVLWPTPSQLYRARGNLNVLLDICDHKSSILTNPPFQQKNQGNPWKNSTWEF